MIKNKHKCSNNYLFNDEVQVMFETWTLDQFQMGWSLDQFNMR